jgi:hypothetical protein
MNIGVPPTPLNDLTGELTPPGIKILALENNVADSVMIFSFAS